MTGNENFRSFPSDIVKQVFSLKEELFEAVGEVVVAQSLDSELVGVHGFDGVSVSGILVTANISDCPDMAK